MSHGTDQDIRQEGDREAWRSRRRSPMGEFAPQFVLGEFADAFSQRQCPSCIVVLEANQFDGDTPMELCFLHDGDRIGGIAVV